MTEDNRPLSESERQEELRKLSEREKQIPRRNFLRQGLISAGATLAGHQIGSYAQEKQKARGEKPISNAEKAGIALVTGLSTGFASEANLSGRGDGVLARIMEQSIKDRREELEGQSAGGEDQREGVPER